MRAKKLLNGEFEMNIIKEMKISQKLLLSICIITVGFIFSIFYLFNSLNLLKVNGEIYQRIIEGKDLIADILPPPNYIIESYLACYELRDNINKSDEIEKLINYINLKLKKEYGERHIHWKNDKIYFQNDIMLRETMVKKSYESAINFYNTLENEYIPAIREKNIEKTSAILNTKLKPLYSLHRKYIDEVVKAANEKNKNIEKDAADKVKIRFILSLVISFSTIFLSLVVFIAVQRQIKSSLTDLSVKMKDISEGGGDLTKKIIKKSNDEIGEISDNYNKFIEKLHGLITHIFNVSHKVATSSTELSSISTQIASNAEEMSIQTAIVASSTGEATANINSISSATEEMSVSVNSVAAAIKEMNTSLSEVAKNCQKELQIAKDANTHAKNSIDVMYKLSETARNIGNITNVINEIAEQTRLLALNATIEAAHAGEAGKGFAVVAGEVKELARQTSDATQKIVRQISEMQTNVKLAESANKAVSAVIDEVNNISLIIVSAVEEQSATVNAISINVNGLSDGAQDVSKNIIESARGLREISANIAGTNNAVADTAKGIVQVKTSAEDLAKMSENLKLLLSQFKL